MTTTQYLGAWIVYLLAASGCLLVWFRMTRSLSAGYFKRLIRWLPAVLVFVPAFIKQDEPWLGPAFLTMLYDGISYGPEAMLRTSEGVSVAAASAFVLAVFGRRKTKAPEAKQEDEDDQPQRTPKRNTHSKTRIEPRLN